MADISSKIQEIKIQLENIQRADRYRQELERVRSTQTAEVDRLRKALDEEHRDLDELDKWSFKELFVKIIDKEQQLEQEKEEYLHAAIAFQDAQKEVELVEFEIGVLREKIAQREALERELQALYDQREATILENDQDHPLKPVLAELARWNQIDRELEEAVLHGVNAQSILEAIAQHLIRGKNWINNGLRDANHSLRMIVQEVDEARLRLPKLRLEFVKFEQELKEVFQYPELEDWEHNQWQGLRQVQQLVQELGGFTQHLIDGRTNSLSLPHQLHRTHTLADNLRHQTETSVKWLQLEREKAGNQIRHLQEKKRELLS